MAYFTAADLRPEHPPQTGAAAPPALLGAEETADIRDFARDLTRRGELLVERERFADRPHVATFALVLRALGAVHTEEETGGHRLRVSGRLARHLPQILAIYLSEPLTLIENWTTTHVVAEDSLSAIELLRQLELRRIELTRRAGRPALPLAERPVAFAVFHARNARGEDCYLFEINKDWRRLNFVGGKQEDSDGGDFDRTVVREISEELGIAESRLSLARLNREPLEAYSLSGNAGSLAAYPCVLYGVKVEGRLDTLMQHRWLTEAQIREFRGMRDGPLMVNPVYLDFLLAGSPSRLSSTPLSTPQQVATLDSRELVPGGEFPVRRWARVLRENKDLLAAIIALTSSLIAAVFAF